MGVDIGDANIGQNYDNFIYLCRCENFTSMRSLSLLSIFLILLMGSSSCNKELNVNAEWQDITVVYGLLDQTDDTTFIKITKAFLGPGDAMQFAKIPDSSYYRDSLETYLAEYTKDTTLVRKIDLSTITIHNKEKGDSIFFYPDQVMHYTTARLNQDYIYQLYIRNKQTGKVVTGWTALVHQFEILRPQTQASFPPGQSFQVKWTQAKEGKRYQLVIRFFYDEYLIADPKVKETKFADWVVRSDIKSPDVPTTQPFDLYFASEGFYSFVGQKIKPDATVGRLARYCDFIFSVAAADMSTYMEVNEPSLSLVQERPAYTNIINGIGLFSSRYGRKQYDTLFVSQITKDELKINPKTSNLGF